MLFIFSSPQPSPAGEGLRATKPTLNGDIAYLIINAFSIVPSTLFF